MPGPTHSDGGPCDRDSGQGPAEADRVDRVEATFGYAQKVGEGRIRLVEGISGHELPFLPARMRSMAIERAQWPRPSLWPRPMEAYVLGDAFRLDTAVRPLWVAG